jgi:PAS domain-containing protein
MLTELVLKARLVRETTALHAELEQARQRLADYSMTLSIMGDLARWNTAAEVQEHIFELFAMLLAPGRMVYVAQGQNGAAAAWSNPDNPRAEAQLRAQLGNPPTEYALTPGGSGFILPIRAKERLLGLLEVTDFAFPEYQDHYLNLALALAPVCGLAIGNAQAYQQVQQAEEQLRSSHEQLQAVLDSVDALVYVVDPVTEEIIFANQRVAHEFGPLAAQTWRQALIATEQTRARGPWLGQAEDMQRVNVWEFQHPDSQRWYACRSRMIQWADSRAVGLLLAVDITERKVIDQELEQAKTAAAAS